MNEFDPTTISTGAGIIGALTYVVMQIVKAITGWHDRRALVAASVVALVLSAVALGAKYWDVITNIWDLLLLWLGAIASGTGLYKLNRKENNGGGNG
jgi:hypothetical protein